jgi:hypothetical protein
MLTIYVRGGRFGLTCATAASTRQLVKQTVSSPALGPQRDNLLSGSCGIAGNTPEGAYALISLKGEGYTPDPLTDGIARCRAVDTVPGRALVAWR